MGEKTAGKYMIKRVYKEESDKRKTIDKIADACIIEEVLYAGKRHLYLVRIATESHKKSCIF